MGAARHAFLSWADLPLDDRVVWVKAYQDELIRRKDDMARLIATETGKPLWEAVTEVGVMIAKVDIAIGANADRAGVREVGTEPLASFSHRPHGVMAILAPFNFPGHLASGHFIPGLIAGNTIVLKPSEYTPMCGLMLADIMDTIGLPSGVFNLVNGGASVGKLVSSHFEVDVMCFTGSSAVGRQLAHTYGRTPEKLLVMEMGGNNPIIVHSTDDIDAAVLTIIQSAFVMSGQRCTCARRLIMIKSDTTPRILDRLCAIVDRLRVGPFDSDPPPFMGPLISQETAIRIEHAIGQIQSLGGRILNAPRKRQGAFLFPTIMDVTQLSKRDDDEYFAPFLRVITVDSVDAAIAEANRTRYGLSSAVISNDRSMFDYISKRLRAGIINWNSPTTGASGKAPFGGIGWSGNHRPTAYYAADYSSYPVVSTYNQSLVVPTTLPPGVVL